MRGWKLNFDSRENKRWDSKLKVGKQKILKGGHQQPYIYVEVERKRPNLASNVIKWQVKVVKNKMFKDRWLYPDGKGSTTQEILDKRTFSSRDDAIKYAKRYMRNNVPKEVKVNEKREKGWKQDFWGVNK